MDRFFIPTAGKVTAIVKNQIEKLKEQSSVHEEELDIKQCNFTTDFMKILELILNFNTAFCEEIMYMKLLKL